MKINVVSYNNGGFSDSIVLNEVIQTSSSVTIVAQSGTTSVIIAFENVLGSSDLVTAITSLTSKISQLFPDNVKVMTSSFLSMLSVAQATANADPNLSGLSQVRVVIDSGTTQAISPAYVPSVPCLTIGLVTAKRSDVVPIATDDIKAGDEITLDPATIDRPFELWGAKAGEDYYVFSSFTELGAASITSYAIAN